MMPLDLPVRTTPELVTALRTRASYLTGEPWEVSATVAMMHEAADRLEEVMTTQTQSHTTTALPVTQVEIYESGADHALHVYPLAAGAPTPHVGERIVLDDTFRSVFRVVEVEHHLRTPPSLSFLKVYIERL
jgi:hypothetical protein